MKYLITTFLVFIAFSSFAQQRLQMREHQRDRIEQLKKIKLMEALNLNEDESIRFFFRYNEFHKQIREFQLNKEKVIDELQDLVRGGEKEFSDKKYDELIKTFSAVENEADKFKSKFFKSLEEILPKYKIAKLIVFEREFARELIELVKNRRRMMMKGKE
jgi:site-specific recombinase